MGWCSYCSDDTGHPHNLDGKMCCPICGKVVHEDNFTEETTFVKNAAGQSQMAGTNVRTTDQYESSRVRTLKEAEQGIYDLMYALDIDGGESTANAALSFYTIALERNFTRGRRKELVQAACLYIHCRVNNKPFLLIDFSERLGVNVYVLGAVFLQLCKLLSLGEHPIVQKPVDPSLFIHRFAHGLFEDPKREIADTALLIIASMKRDWMQTGRKPSGLCGAALYISCLSHNERRSKSEIIKVVHICEATLTKRLIEFENTESGGLTIDEFNMRAKELGKVERSIKSSGASELLCEHKGTGIAHFAHGLCKDCYDDFIKISGGLEGGSEPPAFERAERERLMAKEYSENSPAGNKSEFLNSGEQRSIKNVSESGVLGSSESDLTGATLGQHKIMHESHVDATFEESESLSDIDDTEVDSYLHNEEEKKFKKIIWEELNKEYVEEQAAKEAADLAAKKARDARLANCSEEERAALQLAADAAAAAAKTRKEKQQKRAADIKNLGPAQTAAEAAKQMLDRKRLSSKIRYDVLEKLFEEDEVPENTKKSRTESESNHDDDYLDNGKEDHEVEYHEHMYNENVEEFDYGNDYSHFDEEY